MAIHIKKSHEGLLHKDLGVAAGKHIPAGKLEKAEHSKNAAVKKRAVFAENAKHWHHGGHHASQPHPETNPGSYDTEAHVEKHTVHTAQPHQFSKPVADNAHGFGHAGHQRRGALRVSGHSGAHRIGHK